MRVVVGWKGPERNAASTSEMGRFETELLTQQDNLKGLERLNVEWVKRGVAKTVHRRIILDIDSSESQVHGKQEEAAYNGHFECICYHPLFCFNPRCIGVKEQCSGLATSIAPMGGRSSSSLLWSAT